MKYVWPSPVHVFFYLESRVAPSPLLCCVKGDTNAENGWEGTASYRGPTEMVLLGARSGPGRDSKRETLSFSMSIVLSLFLGEEVW